MLKLKLVQTVPPNAANMAFVRNSSLRPSKNVSMLDFTTDIPEDYGYVEKDRVVSVYNGHYPPTLGSEDGVVFSPRSVMHPDVQEPRLLYYKHVLGAGPRQDSTRRYVLLWDAPFVADECRLELRKAVRIIDDTGEAVSDVNWDLEVESFYTEGGENVGFNVVLWTDRMNYAGHTYYIRYTAYNTSTGETLPNHIEVLNVTPVPYEDDQFHLIRDEGSPGYRIHLINTVDPPCLAPGIALFPPSEGASGWLHTPSGMPADQNIWLYDSDGNATQLWTPADGVITLRDLVALINRYPYLRATCLSHMGGRQGLYQGNYIPVTDGTVIYQAGATTGLASHITHYRHRLDHRIAPKLPVERTPYQPWYPRVSRGEFVELHSWEFGGHTWYAESVYDVPEIYNRQDYSVRYGPGVREVHKEIITVLNDRSLQLQRYPIHDFDSIAIVRDDKEVIVPKDADLINGKVYFDTDLTSISSLEASYAYEADYEYADVNLNPVLLHEPDILGKYIGIYMLPSQIRISRGDPGAYPTWVGLSTGVIYLDGYSVAVEGDTNLDTWEFSGLRLRGNTDCCCKLYGTSTIVGLNSTVYLYKDEQRNELVAQGTGGVAPASGPFNLIAQNNSGLCAQVEMSVALVAGDFTLSISDTRKCVRHVIANSVEAVKDIIGAMPGYTPPVSGHEVGYAKLIAVYQVTQTSTVDEITTLDTRTRGGGIFEDLDPTEMEEARMFWDKGNWDGEPYQSAGAIVMNMPTGITPGTGVPGGILPCNPDPTGWKSANNYLTREQIDGKIKKHIALGIYPLIEWES